MPDEEPWTLEEVLVGLPWRCLTWRRRGIKGPLAVRFAAARIHMGDSATFGYNRHLPAEEG